MLTSRYLFVTVILWALGVATSAAAGDANVNDCNNDNAGFDVRIRGCTNAIQSGKYHGSNLSVGYYNRGNAYLGKGANDSAIADYSKAVQLKPDYAAAYLNRGSAYYNKGDNDSAIADDGRVIQLKSDSADAYNNRGNAYLGKGDYDSAIADYGKAIQLKPDYTDAYFNRGIAFRHKGDYDSVIADYGKLIQIDPGDALAYFNRGVAYGNKGDYGSAIADYGKFIQLKPDDARDDALVYGDLGMVHEDQGDYDSAISDYGKSIQLKPDYALAYRGRGRANLYGGHLAESLADLGRASELDPKDAYAALWLDIVGQRNQVPSRLSEAVAKLDMTKWPAPVVRLFTGQMTPPAVLAAADDPSPQTKEVRVCEANLFAGELAQRNGTRDEAIRLFRLAASDCSSNMERGADVRSAAVAELKLLGLTP